MKLIDEIRRNKISYEEEVIVLANSAIRYLESYDWCKEILGGKLIVANGYILCIFLFEIEPSADSGADNFVWIIVGDIPSAYIDITAVSAFEALECYCELMDEWVANIEDNLPVDDCFPVDAEPSLKHAGMLKTRLSMLRANFLPFMSHEHYSEFEM